MAQLSSLEKITTLEFLRALFRGMGQVMFQNNAISGCLFLLGIFYNSFLMGIGALLGTFIGTICAFFLKYPKAEIKNGLYGFNGTLVGIAVWAFFPLSIISVIALLIGSMLSTILMHEMKKHIPVFTAPFILATWVIILFLKYTDLSPFVISTTLEFKNFDFISATMTGLGQIMFQANVITGILFLLGILINSRIAAAYTIYATLVACFFALAISLPITSINIGIWGYNAVLCAIALGNKKISGFIFATISIALSVFLNLEMDRMGIITLTAPFVITTWILLFADKMRKGNPELKSA